MKRAFLITVLLSLAAVITTAQEKSQLKLNVGQEISLMVASKVELPKLEPLEPEPSRWSGGTLIQVGFSQLSLTNWAAGGFDNVALNTYLNIYRNYEVLSDMFWENRLQLGYGFVKSPEDRFKKNEDKIIFDSKLGYKAIKDLYAAASFNFRSQLANSFNYPANSDKVLISGPFSPAYFSLGVGMDYKPFKPLSINFSPLTGNLVVVSVEELRTKFGNRVDQAAKLELGAQLKFDYKHQITKSLNINSTLNFFSDFLYKAQNIKIYWDLFIDAKISKYFSASIRTNLIYDDAILIADKEGNLAPRLQFKEVLSVGFSYTIGEFKK